MSDFDWGNDFVNALMADVEETPWLREYFDWGRDLMDDVVYPMMEDATPEDLVSAGQAGLQIGSHALNTAASGLGALAALPYGREAATEALERRMTTDPLTPLYTAPEGSGGEAVVQGLGTLFRPVAAAGPALGDAVMELTGNPELATAAHVAPDAALAALGMSPTLRNTRVGLPRPKQLTYTDLFPERSLKGPQPAPPPVGPTGRGGPGKYQEGAIKVTDPDATLLRDMFGVDDQPKALKPVIRSRPDSGPQGDMFPEPVLYRSAIPDAVERMEAETGGKYIPAKEVKGMLERYGVKPEELATFGLTGFLEQAEQEGWELLPSDLIDQANENELMVVTGGEGVSPPEPTPLAPEEPSLSQHLDKVNSEVGALLRTGDNSFMPMLERELVAVGLGDASDGIVRNVRQAVNATMRNTDMPDDVSPPAYAKQQRKDLEDHFKNTLFPDALKTPEVTQKVDKFLDDLEERLVLNAHWRREIRNAPDSDRGITMPGIDANVEQLGATGYLTSHKLPGSIADTITTFNVPDRVTGRKNERAQHFPGPYGFSNFGHNRASRRIILDDNDVMPQYADPGAVYETAAHTDESQFDLHRMAQSEEGKRMGYTYGRDLTRSERYKLEGLRLKKNMLENTLGELNEKRERMMLWGEEGEGIVSQQEYEDFIYKEHKPAVDKVIQEHDDVNQQIKALTDIEEGTLPDAPFKTRVNRTVLTLKQRMLEAAQRGDEWVTMASRRQVAETQSSQEGMEYVEDAVWDGSDWIASNLGSSYKIPPAEMEYHTPSDLRQNLPTKQEFYRREIEERMINDPDVSVHIVEHHLGEQFPRFGGLSYQHVAEVPMRYRKDPAVKDSVYNAGYHVDDWLPEPFQREDVARAIARATGDNADDILKEMNQNEYNAVWDSNQQGDDNQPIHVENETTIEDWLDDEARKAVARMDEYEIESLFDNVFYEPYLYRDSLESGDFWPRIPINDDVIFDAEAAGAATNYDAENVVIPAIKRIHREMGEPPYEPTYKSMVATSDAQYIDDQDYDQVDRVLAFRMTPNMVDKILTQNYMFNPLNEVKTREQRRQASMERRRTKPTSLLFEGGDKEILVKQNGELVGPELELEYDDPDESWLTVDDIGDAGAMRVRSMQRAQGLYPAGRLEGLPETIYVPGRGDEEYGNFQPAVDLAKAYMESKGMEYNPPQTFAELDKRRATRIANEYDRAPDISEMTPAQRAETLASYEAMIEETLDQYRMILDTGLKVDFNYDYKQTRDVIDDVVDNNHMSIFPTEEGFGVDPSFDYSQNPLLKPTEFKTTDGQTMLANDVFRVVHDYFGHVKNGVGFRARGEEAAWQAHASMYSPLARRAMTSETRGQNSWVNYGPEGEYNRTAGPEETRYADQKTTLLPQWVSEEGRLSAKARRERFESDRQNNRTGFEGAIGEDGRLSLIHYSHRPISRTDPSKWGTGLSRTVWSEKARVGEAPPRTFFGIEAADENPYRKERGLGINRQEASVDPELIYDIKRDPDNLWEVVKTVDDLIANEYRLKNAGYIGYFRSHPQIGKVVAMFDELDVVQANIAPE